MPKQWISKFNNIGTLRDITSTSEEICEDLNLDYYIHFAETLASVAHSDGRVVTNLLQNRGISSAVDNSSLLYRGLESIRPQVCSALPGVRLPILAPVLLKGAANIPISDGVMIGTHGASGKVVMSFGVKHGTVMDRDLERLICLLHVMAPYVYSAITVENETPPYSLSRRESECLEWLVQGKTSWEIGKIMGIAERTANFHVGNILRKMNCRNRSEAIGKAILKSNIQGTQ